MRKALRFLPRIFRRSRFLRRKIYYFQESDLKNLRNPSLDFSRLFDGLSPKRKILVETQTHKRSARSTGRVILFTSCMFIKEQTFDS